MAFELIPNTRGVPIDRGESVTVSWRKAQTKTPSLFIYVGSRIGDRMGWSGNELRLQAFYCAETNRLRLVKCKPGDPGARGVSYKQGTRQVGVRLLHLHNTLKEGKPAQTVRFEEEEGGGIVIALPDWARHRGIEGARVAATTARGRANGTLPEARA